VVIYPGEAGPCEHRAPGALRAKAPAGHGRAHRRGKLRCTGATWSDAVVIYPGEALALVNIERQVHALRAKAPGAVVEGPPTQPDPGEDDFEGTE
jgi:hypothetical protein